MMVQEHAHPAGLFLRLKSLLICFMLQACLAGLFLGLKILLICHNQTVSDTQYSVICPLLQEHVHPIGLFLTLKNLLYILCTGACASNRTASENQNSFDTEEPDSYYVLLQEHAHPAGLFLRLKILLMKKEPDSSIKTGNS